MRTETWIGLRPHSCRPLLVVLALAAIGCEVTPVPHAFLPDTAWLDAYRDDMGPVIARDMGVEVPDASFDANVDAPLSDMGAIDSGAPLAVRLDGVFDDAFWSTVGTQPSSTAVLAPYDGDALTALHYGRDENYLYLGFEGTLVVGDAVVIYVDTHFGDGVPLNGGLGDLNGVVNRVLSLPLTSTGEFQPEWGWGTSTMPRSSTVSDPTIGWRRLAANPASFSIWGPTEQTACSTMGCETAIALSTLAVATGGGISLVVRLGRPGVGFSNQTFPVFDASTPELVSDTPITVPSAS